MKVKVAKALANLVKDPNTENVIPGVLDPGVVEAVENAIKT